MTTLSTTDESASPEDEVKRELARIEQSETNVRKRYASVEYLKSESFTPRGHPISGKEDENLENFGAISPYHRYCYSMPGISAADLAKEWKVEPNRVHNWIVRGNWNKVRQKWLETVPVHNGGTLAGDEEEERRQFIAQSRSIWREVMDNTLDMIRQNKQEEASYDALNSIHIQKTADSQLKLVSALERANQQMRLAYGLPSKLSMQISQTSHRREEIKESVVHAPPVAPKSYDLGAAIDPPELPPVSDAIEGEVTENLP